MFAFQLGGLICPGILEVRNDMRRNAARLQAKQKHETGLWDRHIGYLKKFAAKTSHADEANRLRIGERLESAKQRLDYVKSPAYLKELESSLGIQPLQP